MVYGLANKTYEERIKALGIYTLERRRLRGNLIEMFKLLTEKERIDSSQFFQFALNTSDLRRHDKKLFLSRSRLYCRKNFFSQRAIIEWNRLPQNVVNAKSVNSFKNRLDDLWT